MLKNELKKKFLNPFMLLYAVLLPICWYIGTSLVRMNIKQMNSLLINFANDPSKAELNQEVTRQLNAKNGFMVFMEGSSEFYISVAVVLLAGIIFAALFAYDKNTGFGNLIVTRTKFKKYFMCKVSSVFITSFTAVFAVMTAILFVSLIIYSAKAPTQAFNFSMMQDIGPTRLFFSHHWFACFVMIFTLSMLGGLYSLLGMGVSLFTSNRFLISISPLAIYILCTLIPQLFSIQSPIAKYLAWIFPGYFTGIFIGNEFWYSKLPVTAVYFIHLAVIIIPVVALLTALYFKNKKQYIK